jgi:hypothetical protein
MKKLITRSFATDPPAELFIASLNIAQEAEATRLQWTGDNTSLGAGPIESPEYLDILLSCSAFCSLSSREGRPPHVPLRHDYNSVFVGPLDSQNLSVINEPH